MQFGTVAIALGIFVIQSPLMKMKININCTKMSNYYNAVIELDGVVVAKGCGYQEPSILPCRYSEGCLTVEYNMIDCGYARAEYCPKLH